MRLTLLQDYFENQNTTQSTSKDGRFTTKMKYENMI